MTRALVFGGSGQIGDALLPRLRAAGIDTVAVSRQPRADAAGLRWLRGDLDANAPALPARCDAVFSLGPLDAFTRWVVRAQAAVPRIVAFGSTSALTKTDSADAAERDVARRLQQAEAALFAHGERHAVAVTVLRPTLIYGAGRDRTLSRVAAFARRWRFFPLPRNATGLRQPVHVEDLAAAALAVLDARAAFGRAYALPGGETLAYAQMLHRVLAALDPPARLVTLPTALFRASYAGARALGFAAGEGPLQRLDRDLVFDTAPAAEDFGYAPRPFRPTSRMFDAP